MGGGFDTGVDVGTVDVTDVVGVGGFNKTGAVGVAEHGGSDADAHGAEMEMGVVTDEGDVVGRGAHGFGAGGARLLGRAGGRDGGVVFLGCARLADGRACLRVFCVCGSVEGFLTRLDLLLLMVDEGSDEDEDECFLKEGVRMVVDEFRVGFDL